LAHLQLPELSGATVVTRPAALFAFLNYPLPSANEQVPGTRRANLMKTGKKRRSYVENPLGVCERAVMM
jgi:hypothetical protein